MTVLLTDLNCSSLMPDRNTQAFIFLSFAGQDVFAFQFSCSAQMEIQRSYHSSVHFTGGKDGRTYDEIISCEISCAIFSLKEMERNLAAHRTLHIKETHLLCSIFPKGHLFFAALFWADPAVWVQILIDLLALEGRHQQAGAREVWQQPV